MVAMVRAHMADPFLIAKTLEGREREIVRCVGANECLATGFRGRRMHCVMNPAVGREQRWGEGTLQPAPEAKRVAVVGAGPAGLKVAGVAARRGHEVTLFEECDEVGGHLDLLKQLPTRGDWQKMIDNLMTVAEDTGVDVRVGVPVGAADVGGGAFDEVVCATGSVWDTSGLSGGRADRTGIPGADCPNVLDVATAVRRRALDRSCRRWVRRWLCWTTAVPTCRSGSPRSSATRGSRWRSSAGSPSSASTWSRRWSSRGCCRAWPPPG